MRSAQISIFLAGHLVLNEVITLRGTRALETPPRSHFDHFHAFYSTFEAPNELQLNILDTYMFWHYR